MTFDEQIAGVPLPWIQQGWRLQPDEDFDSNWRRQSPANRWEYEEIEVEGAYLEIARPVIKPANGPRVYAHQGWGDGLPPTPEMVKVWAFWWYKAASEPQPHVVEVFQRDEALKYVSARMHERPISQARGEWRGPVLPPMEVA